MKKIILGILILGFCIAAVAVGYFVFNNSEPEPSEPIGNPDPIVEPNSEPEPELPLDALSLDKEQTIPFEQCLARKIDDKVIILVSKYCNACKAVLPILKEIEQELNMEFLYFDLSDKEDLEKFGEFKIEAQWTPTVIIGCDVLIGGYSKEKYKTKIENLLNK